LVVSGFVPALLAAFVIAILSGAITWLLTTLGLTTDGGIVGGIIHLLIAALVLLLSSRIVPGMMVQGPAGAHCRRAGDWRRRLAVQRPPKPGFRRSTRPMRLTLPT
jgi:hypothetical protein